MTAVKDEQTVQAWSDDLGVRIAPAVAAAAKFSRGQPVTVEVVHEGILVRRAAPNPGCRSSRSSWHSIWLCMAAR
jgi:antitoxin component of MazEF toxin-antitoxin module